MSLKDTFVIWGLIEKGFMGDPRGFFFFSVTTGGRVRRVDFWEDRGEERF